ncbi:hypothetical protein [Palleronia caenipelagi]|uniref:SMI1/KNR4 family protein n=1 Tax=Palleronia caenipelagi TaxID=2489174 RepID=A0A547PJK3_9RHOB|nr:hypothetical protein [Palleronia caenipelagi]TRD14313.1 hypothetical protein FEV53_19195 [Palleronia caenipelagi]
MFGVLKNRAFEKALQKSLPQGFVLPEGIWQLIRWLEAKGQCFRYRSSQAMFMPTMPVDSFDQLWSHLAFVIEPDLVRNWFGKDGLEDLIVPLVKCGADGSHFAAWRNGAKTEFVFLGSEGEAFSVTNSVQEFIALITMGYFSIEGRFDLELSPSDNYSEYFDKKWPDPVDVKEYVGAALGVTYPATVESLIARSEEDPFVKFVERTLAET